MSPMLYIKGDQIKKDEMGGYTHGRNAYKVLDGKSCKMKPFIRARQKCEDNIRMDSRETGLEVVC